MSTGSQLSERHFVKLHLDIRYSSNQATSSICKGKLQCGQKQRRVKIARCQFRRNGNQRCSFPFSLQRISSFHKNRTFWSDNGALKGPAQVPSAGWTRVSLPRTTASWLQLNRPDWERREEDGRQFQARGSFSALFH